MPHPTSTPPVIDGRDTEASRFSDAIDSFALDRQVHMGGGRCAAFKRWSSGPGASPWPSGEPGKHRGGTLAPAAAVLMASSSTWRRYPNRGGVAGRTAGRVQGSAQRVYPPGARGDRSGGNRARRLHHRRPDRVVGTERVRRTNDGSYPPVQVAARLYAKWGDEPDRARLAIWTAALNLTLEHEAPAVQTVVLNLLLERAFRALIAADLPRDTDAALTWPGRDARSRSAARARGCGQSDGSEQSLSGDVRSEAWENEHAVSFLHYSRRCKSTSAKSRPGRDMKVRHSMRVC